MVIQPFVVTTVMNLDNGESRKIYAMLDTGSDRDVVSEELVQEHGL